MKIKGCRGLSTEKRRSKSYKQNKDSKNLFLFYIINLREKGG
jgi:hypothetical protein